VLRKFLFVGLGGSGGKTLRFLRHDLQQWLAQIGWPNPDQLPAGWQLLHIDTPTAQDGQEITEVDMLPAESYLGLVMSGVGFGAVSNKLTTSVDGAWEELASWRVDPTFLQVPITTGAGQFRAVGRTIGLAYADKILNALRGAATRLSAATASAELSEVHQLAFGTQAMTPQDPTVIVISSLAGGTGAGLLLDVCDLLRQIPGGWGGHSFGILYASDVFQHLGELATAGVQPNALAALSELMNGYWLTANNPRASALFQVAGAPVPIAKSGPAFPFLVGASNTKGVTFGDQKSVYSMMGRALRSWAVDPAVQIKLIEYTKANWQSSAEGNSVRADIVVRDHSPVFEAFGYAEVGLGVERFETYATQRLAKLAARWLWDGHLRLARDIDRNDARTPAEVADDFARGSLVPFLQNTRLLERGDNNQIIDALQPADADALLDGGTATALDLSIAGVKALTAPQWAARIMSFIPGVSEEYLTGYDTGLRRQVAAWIEQAPPAVLEELERVIARYGLQTAARLLELVIEEITVVCTEIDEEAQDFLRWSADARGNVAAELSPSGNIPAQHPSIEAAVRAGLWSSGGYRAEAKRREVGRQLMKDFAQGFLTPLALAIRNAAERLHSEGFVGDGITPPVAAGWPDAAVPDSLKPPPNEQLVVDLDQFPSLYTELLAASTKSELPGQQEAEARDAVITGDFLALLERSGRTAPVAIAPHTPWAPDPALLLGAATPRTAARFTVAFSPADLLKRSEAWLRRQGTAFERFFEADLRSYLDDDPHLEHGEMADRRSRFRTALGAALDSAEPLVRVDPGLLSLLHQRASLQHRAVPSQLPFRDHPVEASAREMLAAKLQGGAGASVDDYFTTASRVRSISITSTLGAAHDPLVFSSITAPIIAGWGVAAQSPPARTNFWNNRRARPLTEFVPASQEVLLAMTRGWFTGLLLGKIDRDGFRIVHDGSVAHFPSPLLREPGHQRDKLPAVLESLGIAYAEVAKLHTLAPLHAYVALRDLGVQPGLPSYQAAHVYDHLNAELDRWIRTDDPGETIEQPLVMKVLEGDGPEARRKAALGVLQRNLQEYRDDIDTYANRGRRDPNTLGSAYGLWPGMWPVIHVALQNLVAALENMSLHDDSLSM